MFYSFVNIERKGIIMEQKINSLQANQRRQPQNNNGNIARQRTAGSSSSPAQAARTVGSRSDYGIARNPSAIHVGDVLRGEITDLRNNEISITLEDNTVIRAKIPNSSSYSIGQTGSFRLTDIAGGTIYLENISVGYSDTELTLINKALDEAGLPSTEHNQATVKALMDNLLPINRASIQNLMQQSYDLGTDDMNTLAVMKRLMMKMDADSVAQFSNYRNENYQLLERLQSFSRDIPSLLGALAENGPADAVADFGRSLLSIGLPSSPPAPTATIAGLPAEVQEDIIKMLANTHLTEELSGQLDQGTLSLLDALTLIRDSALSGSLSLSEEMTPSALAEQINQINQVLEPAASDLPLVTEDLLKNIAAEAKADDIIPEEAAQADGEPAVEVASREEGRFAFAGKLFQTLSENAKTLSDTLGALRNGISGNTAQENQAIAALTKSYEIFARNNDLLSTYLSANERSDLIEHLQNLPISRNMLLKIASGEASTTEVLSVINNASALTDSEKVQELFRSEVFQKLFARELQSSWTLTPEQLAKENISSFYSKMHRQMQQFHSLIQNTLSGSDSQELSSFAHDIDSNISFMKTLNETFSYFQLPLKLPSQDAHGDLYVYSRKEKMRQNPEKASVLLHLNLEHLGQIDIKLDKNRNDIGASFSLNDMESVHLFRTNADMLTNALNSQGFRCAIQIQEKEAPSPTVDDFINTKVNTRATNEMKRFSFDIRA